MKQLSVSLLLLLCLQGISQLTHTANHLEVKDLMRKSATQKSAAFILASLSPMILIFDTPSTSMTGRGINSDGKSEHLHAASYVLSAACLIGGVALFKAASRNRAKAKDKNFSIQLEHVQIATSKRSFQSLPALGIKIGWD
jgi:hypothetical protein